MWHPQELKEVPTASWDALGGNCSDGGRAADEASLRCLRMLRRFLTLVAPLSPCLELLPLSHTHSLTLFTYRFPP